MSDTAQTITAQTALPEAKGRQESWGFASFWPFSRSTSSGAPPIWLSATPSNHPPLYTAGFRHLVAGSALLAWPWQRASAHMGAGARQRGIGFFFFLLGHGSLHWAEQYVPSGLCSL